MERGRNRPQADTQDANASGHCFGFFNERYFRVPVTRIPITKPVAALGIESPANPIVVEEVSVSYKVRVHFGPIGPGTGVVALAERI